MEPDLQQRIEKTVLEILEQSDMDNTTEYKVRTLAAEKLNMDLSPRQYKAFVRKVVESFLRQKADQDQPAQEEEEAEAEAEDEEEDKRGKKSAGDKKYNENGELIICNLSAKRKVTMQEFRGKTLVSIREFYNKGGEDLPTAKGISLTEEQWSTFRKHIPAIENAIKKMQSQA